MGRGTHSNRGKHRRKHKNYKEKFHHIYPKPFISKWFERIYHFLLSVKRLISVLVAFLKRHKKIFKTVLFVVLIVIIGIVALLIVLFVIAFLYSRPDIFFTIAILLLMVLAFWLSIYYSRVRCPRCKETSISKHSEELGRHQSHETEIFTTTKYNKYGEEIGTEETERPVTVTVVRKRIHYHCTNCGYRWEKDIEETH